MKFPWFRWLFVAIVVGLLLGDNPRFQRFLFELDEKVCIGCDKQVF